MSDILSFVKILHCRSPLSYLQSPLCSFLDKCVRKLIGIARWRSSLVVLTEPSLHHCSPIERVPLHSKCKNEYMVLALEEETAAQTVVGSIVLAFRKLKMSRSWEMSARGYALVHPTFLFSFFTIRSTTVDLSTKWYFLGLCLLKEFQSFEEIKLSKMFN